MSGSRKATQVSRKKQLTLGVIKMMTVRQGEYEKGYKRKKLNTVRTGVMINCFWRELTRDYEWK